MMKIIELTKENEKQYLEQITQLEQITVEAMKKEGREGQLFPTGKEGISEYVHSNQDTVIVATDENGRVEATTYITQGQNPFTYNDITKYFKYGDKYKKYVKSQYSDVESYKKDLLKMYTIKIKAFEYAKKRILTEHTEQPNLQTFFQQEVEENGFHEKSELREKMNKYMSQYIEQNFGTQILRKYEQFYWTTAKDIFNETGKQCNIDIEEVKQYEQILHQQELVIHEQPEFEQSKYFSANTSNSIELDTYISSPNIKRVGTARIIIFEGVKKHIERHFANPENKEIFLCSTLHRDNLPSKYVSEFFGLTDSLYVNRRQGRNREVHICKIEREKAMEYITSISDKLAIFYGYNPNQKTISESTRLKILEEQLEYEKNEHIRLGRLYKTDKMFSGPNVKFIEGKARKIQKLEKEIDEIRQRNKGEQ